MLSASATQAVDDLFSGSDNLLGPSSQAFLNVEDAYQVTPSLNAGELTLDWQVAPGYYLYKHRFKLLSVDDLQPIAVPITFSSGTRLFDEYYQKELEVFYRQAHLTLSAKGLPNTLVIESQGCADAGLCYPPRKQLLTLNTTADTAVVSEFSPLRREAQDNPQSTLPLTIVLLFAVLGGLILNLMPCVFPVLSIKALSLTTSHLNTHGRHLHGLAYTLGIVLSFIAIAAALLVLRASGEALGWGFQLQSPLFIGALVYLFVVMGLSFSGFFYIGTRLMNLGQAATQGQSLQSSFMTGVLATIVASPCTAPFMGSAVGVALTQPGIISLLIFAALGLGMALPFLLLSWWPTLSRLLPKPGPWMETFKQFLAFPLYLSATWLLWVLGRQTDINIVAAVVVGVILIIFAIWITHNRAHHPLRLAVCVAALILAVAIPISSLKNKDQPKLWEAFSTTRLNELRQENRRVFVNLTADWCITCLANEKIALSSDVVKNAFRDNQVSYLKGDWTNYDVEITNFLNQHGRSGVPLYLFYEKGSSTPKILPQLLTEKIVISTISEK